jgi:transposase
MTNSIPHHAGIDISKQHLDAHVIPGNHCKRFPNTPPGWRTLGHWLMQFAPQRIVYESTGPYHKGMERALASQDLPIVRANARRVRSFADAIGIAAKTDNIDADVLARYSAIVAPDVTKIAGQELEELKELESARRALVKAQTTIASRKEGLTSKLLKRQANTMSKLIVKQIAEIDKTARLIIETNSDLNHRYKIIRSIPGLGPVAALSLIVLMPELGRLDEKQVASLAGLAPFARDSGSFNGKRHCHGGRRNLRRTLYMPALVAMRFNPDLEEKYRTLRACGKPAKVAITAIMRKLLILANALVRDGRNWTPTAP